MAEKISEAGLQQIGVFTNELYKLKERYEDYSIEDFEYEFNKIKSKFEQNKLPFKFTFDSFIEGLEFEDEEESSSYFEDESSYDD